MKTPSLFVVGILAVGLAGCSGAPKTFVSTHEQRWISTEIRDDVPYDRAWKMCLDVIAKRFEVSMVSKEAGLIQTTWTPIVTEKDPLGRLSARVTLLFSPNRRVVQMRLSARFQPPEAKHFIYGFDTDVTNTLKADIMGVVGRTTR